MREEIESVSLKILGCKLRLLTGNFEQRVTEFTVTKISKLPAGCCQITRLATIRIQWQDNTFVN